MNVPLKVLTVFRNNSMAFCFHLSLQNLIPKKKVFLIAILWRELNTLQIEKTPAN